MADKIQYNSLGKLRFDRQLPDRSKIIFYFPNPKKTSKYITVALPFFENINIKESKSARYAEFKLLSRSSNIYGYMGADSRKFDLSFNITLPHLQYEHPEITLNQFIKKIYDTNSMTSPPEQTKKNVLVNQASKLSEKFLSRRRDEYSQIKTIAQVFDPSLTADSIEKYFGPIPEQNKDLVKTVNMILYWTNIVRSSVVNNANNPLLGPPIIRLTHGILYQDIPCICKSYNIDFNNSGGFEIETLMPRVLTFSLALEEVRVGDFGKFKKFSEVERDNLTGYESILGDDQSMDPGPLNDLL